MGMKVVMGIAVAQETTLFVTALLLGAAAGALYDVFRVLRLAFRHSSVAVALEDLLFFLLFTGALWRYFLELCTGEVRIFVLLGVALGWTLYFFTLGAVVLRAAEFILELMRKIIGWILTPVRKIGGLLKKTGSRLTKVMLSGKNRLKSCLYMLYNGHK